MPNCPISRLKNVSYAPERQQEYSRYHPSGPESRARNLCPQWAHDDLSADPPVGVTAPLDEPELRVGDVDGPLMLGPTLIAQYDGWAVPCGARSMGAAAMGGHVKAHREN
jgi:hypothetical protein